MTRTALFVVTLLVTAAIVTIDPHVTQAQDAASGAPLRLEIPQASAAATARYWTPERLASARPRTPIVGDIVEAPLAPRVVGIPRGSSGRAPDANVAPNWNRRLFDLSAARTVADDDAAVVPQDAGTLKAHFTSSRLIPYAAVGVYPFSAAGKLFFSDGGDDFVCSASVINFRVVVTAGHCVHEGSGGSAGFFENFMYVPAYVVGVAPYGTWSVAVVLVTNTWAMGNGVVPNAADYAMFEMQDRASGRIGSVTGFLGWQVTSLNPNHVSMLGYPASFDGGLLMHRVDAGSFRNTAPNTVEYGSDMTGGSSGGPWVQNLGEPSSGQTGGINPGLNRVVGVTSYGFTGPGPKTQGASVPDQRWVDLFNSVCANRAGNCTP
jgi:V8-like Glu-specific endopeptidase